MRCKVILSTDSAVEIVSELEQVDKKHILILLKEFNSYSEAKDYVLSKECVYSAYFVIEIADIIMVLPKREIGKYNDFTLLKAFVTKEKAEKYKDDCYNITP